MERYTPRERASEARHALPQAAANMSAHAYGILSGMIMRRELRGGDKLVEQRLAEQLQISRTPLREAMQRLEGEGLIRKGATRSYVVRVVEMREYLQSLRVRKVLEAEAAALAAGKVGPEEIARVREVVLALERMVPYNTQAHWACDDEVHNLFIDACGNGVMAAILRDMRVTTRLFEIAQLAERLGPDSREHLAILDAIEAGDSEKARAAMAAHAQSLFDFAVGTIS
ncbi:GntR family transcriptional regulator [Chelativorans sp. ZYF759]|uniref:GntR family transcriptional regulator n=1 Tax=Chelativorans sp. ZYF759 TaxID=2692213 RepID=UPI0034D4B9FF